MGSQLVLRIEFPSQMTLWEGLGIASPRGVYTVFLAKTGFFPVNKNKNNHNHNHNHHHNNNSSNNNNNSNHQQTLL